MFTLKLLSSFFLLLILSKDFVNADRGVVSKKDWHGLEPTQEENLPQHVDLVIIQHTVTPTCTTDTDCENIVRSIQKNHMNNRHFWDIGESFLVGSNGKVYEGTGWLHVGAHTYGYNKKVLGFLSLVIITLMNLLLEQWKQQKHLSSVEWMRAILRQIIA